MEDLLFVDEAAKELRVTRKTLYDWMREGKLDFVTVGGRRRIPRAALLALIKPSRSEDEAKTDEGSDDRMGAQISASGHAALAQLQPA